MNRRQLIRTCKQHGFLLQPEALKAMQDTCSSNDVKNTPHFKIEHKDDFMAVLQQLQRIIPSASAKGGPLIVTADLWKQALQELMDATLAASAAMDVNAKSSATRDDDDDNPAAKTANQGSQTALVSPSKKVIPATTAAKQATKSSSVLLPISIISAFDMPRLSYDSLRQQFYYASNRDRPDGPSSVILGSALDKVERMIQRFELIKQRLLRHQLFRSSTHQRRQQNYWLDTESASVPSLSLTSIDRLLGTNSVKKAAAGSTSGKPLVLLGLLKQNSEATLNTGTQTGNIKNTKALPQYPFVLEDPTGQVMLDLTNAQSATKSSTDSAAIDGYVTDHCMILVQGVYESDSGIFLVHHLGFPPAESQTESRTVVPMAPYCSSAMANSSLLVNSKNGAPTLPPLQVYIFSQCHLDQPEVIMQIEEVLKKIVHRQQKQSAMCFMGNFVSTGAMSRTAASSLGIGSASRGSGSRFGSSNHPLCELAALISESYPFVAQHTQLVFIPGPADSSLPVLPQPALRSPPPSLLSGIQNWRMATNPCRLVYGEQEIVLFRQGLTDLLLQTQVLQFPQSDETDQPSASQRVARTIVEQGHLVPVAPHQRPLFWNCDHAMRLYPLPDAIIVGDSTPYAHSVHNCPVLSPGNALGKSDDGTDDDSASTGYLHLTLRGHHVETGARRGSSRNTPSAKNATLIRLYQNGSLSHSNASGSLRAHATTSKKKKQAAAAVTAATTISKSQASKTTKHPAVRRELSTTKGFAAFFANKDSDKNKSSLLDAKKASKPHSATEPSSNEDAATKQSTEDNETQGDSQEPGDTQVQAMMHSMGKTNDELDDTDNLGESQETGIGNDGTQDADEESVNSSPANEKDAASQELPFSQMSQTGPILGENKIDAKEKENEKTDDEEMVDDDETPQDADVLNALDTKHDEEEPMGDSQLSSEENAASQELPFSQMSYNESAHDESQNSEAESKKGASGQGIDENNDDVVGTDDANNSAMEE